MTDEQLRKIEERARSDGDLHMDYAFDLCAEVRHLRRVALEVANLLEAALHISANVELRDQLYRLAARLREAAGPKEGE